MSDEAISSPPAPLERSAVMARPPGWQSRTFLLVACVLACALFAWAGGAFGISRERGFNGSLLMSPGGVDNVLVTGVLILAAVVVGTLLAGFVRPDAGLFAAAIGLTALSGRGGAIPDVLHDASGR